jgi:hypothetical protein
MALRTWRSLVPRQEIWPSQFAGNTRKVSFTISSVPPPATRTQKLATTADMFRSRKYSQYTQGELNGLKEMKSREADSSWPHSVNNNDEEIQQLGNQMD